MTSTDRQRAHIDAETVATARPASRRSTSNSNTRGSSETRRRRRRWLVREFGDGKTCACYRCGATLTEDTVSPDRIIPGCEGGTYARNNIRPACDLCQMQTGGALGYSRRGK